MLLITTVENNHLDVTNMMFFNFSNVFDQHSFDTHIKSAANSYDR